MKKYLLLLPEAVILALSIYWFLENYFGANHINYIALSVFLIVVTQILVKSKILGMTIGAVISAFSLFMVFAVLSEFKDFQIVNSEAIQLLLVGMLLCFSGLISATILFYKYSYWNIKQ